MALVPVAEISFAQLKIRSLTRSGLVLTIRSLTLSGSVLANPV